MIYLDNSATTYPKPLKVRQAVANAMQMSANPGRSGHDFSIKASEEIFKTRSTAAKFFNFSKEENIIFTLNCTTAINIVLKGILKNGDHVVVSSLEHNAVMRPLEKLTQKGVSYTVAEVFPCDNDKTVNSFRNAINGKTKLIICTHASNVWGIKLPIERISALAHEYGVLFATDTAQSAGVIPIDLYKFCVTLQNVFMRDISSMVASSKSVDLAEVGLEVLESSFSPVPSVKWTLLSLVCMIAYAYCVVKIFFANIKRGGILLVQIAVGSLYMFSVPRGYQDGFNQWIKQVIAICLTAFLQTAAETCFFCCTLS